MTRTRRAALFAIALATAVDAAALARRSPDLRLKVVGRSQEHRDILLLIFARTAAVSGQDVLKNGKPTVLIIGQQHGNEPAGGEAALALAAQLVGSDRSEVLDR